MKDSPSMPAAPNYGELAQQQGRANIDAARVGGRISNPNINTPYGNQTVSWGPQMTGAQQNEFDAFQQYGGWEQTDGGYRNTKTGETSANPVGEGRAGSMTVFTPEQIQQAGTQDQATVTQTLNPQSQEIFDQQQKLRLGLANLGDQALSSASQVLGSGFDTSGIPQMAQNAGMTTQDALMHRLAPQLDRRREALHTQMLNEGHVRGNEGYNRGMEANSQADNDALIQAGMHGVNADMAANAQGFQQAAYQRNLPLNEITALMSGSQIQNPQFQQFQGQNVAPSNPMQAGLAQGQFDQGIYNAGVARANSGNQALTSAAMAAMYF